ncbi:MAG: M1 family aminopeptidase [Bacteroidales bacterium]
MKRNPWIPAVWVFLLLFGAVRPSTGQRGVFFDLPARGYADPTDRKPMNVLLPEAVGLSPEHALLMEGYDVRFYGLDVELSNRSEHIRGKGRIVAEVVAGDLDSFVVQLIDELAVAEVRVAGIPRPFTHRNDVIEVPLSPSPSPGSLLDVQISYEGEGGEGLVNDRDPDWDMEVTYTLSEPFYAKDWFPVKEVLSDKADSVHVFITTPYGLTGVSNGLLAATTYFPNGRTRYEWKSRYPIAFYLISAAVADYQRYDITARPPGEAPVLIQNFVYDLPGCLEAYRDQIDVTVPILEVYSEHFGPYPFSAEKYGHYFWPWGGGMEHQTMTGMGNFEFYLVAHELGHSWFGDMVTCSNWQDIWINEGFATYAGYLATEVLAPSYAEEERAYRFGRALQEPEGSVYVPLADADNDSRIFSGNLSYNKGMALIHMIRDWLQDDDLFFDVLRTFLERHAHGVASGEDFRAVLEERSGMDFAFFFDQWYYGKGFPRFEVQWSVAGGQLFLQSDQTGSSAATPFFRMPMEYRVFYPGGDSLIRVLHENPSESYVFPFDHPVDNIRVDPRNNVLDEASATKALGSGPVETSSVVLFPNPAGDRVTLMIGRSGPGSVRVELLAPDGRRLREGSWPEVLPGQKWELSLAGIRPGLYMVRVTGAGFGETHKLIVR